MRNWTDWKTIITAPYTALAFLAMFAGLLVDYQGAMSKVAAAIPVVAAFLPLLAIGGTTFFGLWSITSIWTFFWSRRPAARFGRLYHTVVQSRDAAKFAMETAPRWTPDIQTNPGLYADLRQLSDILRRLGIECPSVFLDDQKYSSIWFAFLTELSSLAFHGDLTKARRLKKLMSL